MWQRAVGVENPESIGRRYAHGALPSCAPVREFYRQGCLLFSGISGSTASGCWPCFGWLLFVAGLSLASILSLRVMVRDGLG